MGQLASIHHTFPATLTHGTNNKSGCQHRLHQLLLAVFSSAQNTKQNWGWSYTDKLVSACLNATAHLDEHFNACYSLEGQQQEGHEGQSLALWGLLKARDDCSKISIVLPVDAQTTYLSTQLCSLTSLHSSHSDLIFVFSKTNDDDGEVTLT